MRPLVLLTILGLSALAAASVAQEPADAPSARAMLVMGPGSPESQDAATVDVAVGGLTIAAEVTRDAVQRLTLVPGRPVYALVKAVSVDVAGTAAGVTPRR